MTEEKTSEISSGRTRILGLNAKAWLIILLPILVSRLAAPYIAEYVADLHMTDYERRMNELSDRIEKIPAISQRIQGMSQTEIKNYTKELTQSGMRRVDSITILQRAEILRQITEVADDDFCAGFWSGQLDEVKLSEHIGNLPDKERDLFYSIVEAAVNAEIRNDPIVVIGESERDAAWGALDKTLAPEDVSRFYTFLEMKNPDKKEAAWAVRQLYRCVAKIPEPHNVTFARLLLGASTETK